MLVLSRRVDEKIVFPGLGVSLKVLRIKGNVVKLGVEAPAEIKILRDEVPSDDMSVPGLILSREARHDFSNRMNTVTIGLHLTRRLLDAGRYDEVQDTFARVLGELGALNEIAQAPPLLESGVHRTALLVEDDQNERELLAAYLRLSGFEVDAVHDGVDALDHLHQRPLPDLVLLDMQMPRLDGAQTIHSIRQDPALRALRVFAISGTRPGDLGVPTDENGVDRWFPKPLNPESLVREIKAEFAPVQQGA